MLGPPGLTDSRTHLGTNGLRVAHAHIGVTLRSVGSYRLQLRCRSHSLVRQRPSPPHIWQMRAHFIKYIEMQDINNFPPYERPRRLGRRRCMSMKEVRVYCTCRLPWNKSDKSKEIWFAVGYVRNGTTRTVRDWTQKYSISLRTILGIYCSSCISV